MNANYFIKYTFSQRLNFTCGDCSVAHKSELIEILEFTHFCRFYSFDKIGDNHKEKNMMNKISVVVATFLRIPKVLFTEEIFKGLSLEVKVLYLMIRGRKIYFAELKR